MFNAMFTNIPLILGLIPCYLCGTIFLSEPADFYSKVNISACFLEHEGKILLLHRQENTSQGNLWGIPGGKVEKTETPAEAVVREVCEETGWDISKLSIVDLGKVYIKYPTFDYVYYMFKCQPLENPSTVKID